MKYYGDSGLIDTVRMLTLKPFSNFMQPVPITRHAYNPRFRASGDLTYMHLLVVVGRWVGGRRWCALASLGILRLTSWRLLIPRPDTISLSYRTTNSAM